MAKASKPAWGRCAVYVSEEWHSRLQSHRKLTGRPMTYAIEEALWFYFEGSGKLAEHEAEQARALVRKISK